MRKFGIVLLIIIFVIVLFDNVESKKEIRVRIIPNSNENGDLLAKEEVKDYTIYYLQEAYSEDYNEFVQNINKTKKEFELILEKVLAVDCTIKFANHTLYNKTYNNSAIKNEETLVLYIIIGKGEGSNWWGTVYPNFLEISSSDEIEYESLIVNLFQKIRGEYK